MTPTDEAAFWQRVVSAIEAHERRLAARFLEAAEANPDAWEGLDALVDLSFVYQAQAGAARRLDAARTALASEAWERERGIDGGPAIALD